MGRVTIVLIVILVLALAGGFVVLAYWDFPAPIRPTRTTVRFGTKSAAAAPAAAVFLV